MDPELYRNSTAGRCIRTPEGYWAFFPSVLPPELPVDWETATLLSQASAALGELSGAGRRLADPHLLVQPYIRREAVMSSRIENIQAGLDDLFSFEADDTVAPRTPDVVEVANYVGALEYGLQRVRELPISGRLIREIHERLMRGIHGGRSSASPGEFRRSQNWIGPPGCTLTEAPFVPPPVEAMHEALGAWESYLNRPSREPLLIRCALMHYQFEAIHPFLDGNGRMGRLLISLLLCERDALSQPLLYLSAFFERHRDEYYRRLLAVSQRGDWRGWIEFFLRGIAMQAREAVACADALLDLRSEYVARIEHGRAPRTATRIVDHLFGNPIVSIAGLARLWGVEFPTVQRGIRHLVSVGILQEMTGRRRNRLFVAPKLRELLTGQSDRPRWESFAHTESPAAARGEQYV